MSQVCYPRFFFFFFFEVGKGRKDFCAPACTHRPSPSHALPLSMWQHLAGCRLPAGPWRRGRGALGAPSAAAAASWAPARAVRKPAAGSASAPARPGPQRLPLALHAGRASSARIKGEARAFLKTDRDARARGETAGRRGVHAREDGQEGVRARAETNKRGVRARGRTGARPRV